MGRHGELIDTDRRLWSLEKALPGYLHMLRCTACGHLGAMPIDVMLKRFGAQMPLATVLPRLRCAKCDGRAVEAVVMMLCEPGCHRHRG
jgi:hypothetical protein